MPLPPGHWIVDIEKMLLGEYWTNRYIVAGADMLTAHNVGRTIATAERSITSSAVLYTRFRTSDAIPDTDVYQVENINQFGGGAVGSPLLPLFCVVRVDFNTDGGGRPSRKYLRGILTEGSGEFNTILQGAISAIVDNYIEPLVANAAYVDVDGQAITSGSVYPFVGMRQLRRGSKRKAPVADTPE